jgi:hypothetical protein
MRTREAILHELTTEQVKLVALERELSSARGRIDALNAELQTAPVAKPTLPLTTAVVRKFPATPADKVKLFRSLFRGRVDVFPVRFVSKKTGNPGYAPACSNKWEPGLCHLKSGGKCSDCPNQAFVPVEDRVVIDHLRGRHVIGCYPMLEDETTWFLAVDFDKGSWKEDVSLFAETSHSLDIPVAIERSRSGNGAHAWFFFASPVSANIARRMGCYLLTVTMDRRHELSMQSYDRLFPNQDTMPRGGFGNLIALPLQHESRQFGNSVFIDPQFEPFPDQWAFLASVPRIDPALVAKIAQQAIRTDQVTGVRLAELTDEQEDSKPWTIPPSRRDPETPIAGPLPSTVRAVLSQRLYIEKQGLPAVLLNRLKRLAAFQNPEFYKKQRMRLSTALTPRVITCAEELAQFVSLPRGCTPAVEQLLLEHQITLEIEDERQLGSPLDLTFHGDLTPIQSEATRTLLLHDTGIFVGPPGIGKTVLGTHLIASRARNTLILVHRKPLLEQWVAQLAMFLDIDEKKVGRIGGGHRKHNGTLDVAMIQSLVKRDDVDELVTQYGHVIVDEMSSRSRHVLRESSFRGEGSLHHGTHGHSTAPRRTSSHRGDAIGTRPLQS